MAKRDDVERLSGPKKAAMALLSMGVEASAQILKNLTTAEIKELSLHMSYIEGVRKEISDELLQEFTSKFRMEGGVNVDGDEFVRHLLPTVMQVDEAREVIAEIDEKKQKIPFKHLRDIDARLLSGFIKGEHPQTIAIIVSHLDHQKASMVLGFLPEHLQFEVVGRIASFSRLSRPT